MPIQVNQKPVPHFNFSGGECHVSISEIAIGPETEILALLYNSDDVMCLLMTVDAIRRKDLATKIHLTIPYFPYARQDRVCNEGEAFSVSVMAGLINRLNCHSVTVFDPHSKTTPDLLKNCRIVTQADILENSGVAKAIKEKDLWLVAPDAGAEMKTRAVSERLKVAAIYCTKTRDPKTRNITQTHIPEGVEGKDFMILDDICDGGRTFIQLASALKKAGANKLYLYVTHGIFSQGLDVLKAYFEQVYCFHCLSQINQSAQPFLTVMQGVTYEN